MWPHFNRNDVGIIAHYLGMLVMVLGILMIVPLLVSILYGEWAASSHYVLGMGVTLTFGALLLLVKVDSQRMGHKHAIAITGLVWIVGAFVAAIPLFLSGHYLSFFDALFEGVSGLTASGLTLVQDIDHMSMADNMWRFTMQLIGGQGVVVIALSLGIFTRTGNALYISEARDDAIVPNVKNTARFIWKFALAAVTTGTIVLTAILIAKGMSPDQGFFHGLWITIGAYDTGGFAPTSLSLMAYHSWPLEIVVMLLMMFGALSFAVIAQVHKGNWREFVRDIEVRTLAIWTTIMAIVFVAALSAGDFLTDFSGLMRRGVFTIVSATTNTGFQVLSTEQITTLFSSGAFLLAAVAMAMGGSSASTAGGIKALRVGLIFKGIGLQVRRILQPRSAQITTSYNHVGKHQLTPELLSSALIIAALYVISYIVGALAGIAYGYEALPAIFDSIAAASNAGLSSGIIQPSMPLVLKIVYILQMWLGRLEFITLLGLFASLIASILPRPKPKPGEPEKQGKLGKRNAPNKYEKAVKHKIASTKRKKGGSGRSGSKGFSQASCATILAIALAVFLMLAPLQNAYGSEEGSTIDEPSVSTGVSGQENTISALRQAPEPLDKTVVALEGEVVGSKINANADHVWIMLSDGNNSMSVYLPKEYEEYITHYGGYAHRGTSIKLTGEFNLACTQHDGTTDVHALSSVSVIEQGGAQVHSFNPLFLVAGGILILVASGLGALYYYLNNKRR